MATIKDVAKAAGVGTGTVSRALSGKGYVDSEKKKQIIKIAEQLEYDPSALLKRKNNKKVKSGLIGVVLPNSSQPFFGSFLWHVEKALEMHEYRTVIINVGGSSQKISDAIDLVDKHMLDGLIINADVDKSDIERLRLIPAVSFECEMGEGIPLVASDHIKGGELAAKLLFRCGCKNVAILSIKATAPVYARRRITECQRLLKKEDGILDGGFGEKIARFYGASNMKVMNYGLKKEFLDRYDVDAVLKDNHLTAEQVVEDVLSIS